MTTLKFRAFQYCSNNELLRAELDHLQKTFVDNGYPEDLVSIMLKKNNDVVAGNVGDGNEDFEEGERKGWLIVPYVKEVESMLKVCV